MKKNFFIRIIMAILVSFTVFSAIGFADEEIKKEGQLTVPWEEFKELLPLDKDEIVLSMETFQKLLVYTGIKIKPAYTLNQGHVVLTKDEFKKFVDKMKPLTESSQIVPPFDYLITKAAYNGKVKNQSASFVATFNLQVLKEEKYLKIPLLPQHIALENITVNGKPALVIAESGYHHILVSEKGEYIATVSFSIKTTAEKGAHKINLPIQPTPITALTFELPGKDIDIEIPQAQQILATEKNNSTLVSASIAPNRLMDIRWKKKVAAAEQIPPKLYSEIYHLISIDDDVLKINSEVVYKILHSKINSVQLEVPDDINILNVSGDGVGEWQEIVKNDQRFIFVPFTYGKKGNTSIHILSEKPLSEKSVTNDFAGIRTLGTIRETGFIGIELNTSAEVNVTDTIKLEKTAVQKLPATLYNKSAKPLMHAFRYLKHPFSLVFDVKKHQKVAVPVAAIDSANMVTLFTEDGKVVHRLVYHVRNSAKQFLEIQLPKNADIWSVFVDEKPVESSLNTHGNLLVPLIKSRSENNILNTFPVEIIYCLTGNKLSLSGALESHLPSIDLLISQMIWSVYLPNDFAYHYFDSSLEKEEIIQGIKFFSGKQRQYNEKAMNDLYRSKKQIKELKQEEIGGVYKGKDYKSNFTNLPIIADEISSQVNAELEFSGRLSGLSQQKLPRASVYGNSAGAGVMPIQIKIPTGGQVYRFAKTIVSGDDPLSFKVVYSRNQMAKIAKWFIMIMFIGCLYLIRKAIINVFIRIKKRLHKLYGMAKQHEDTIKTVTESKMTLAVLFGLMIVVYAISFSLSLLVFFLIWICAFYQLLLYRKQKASLAPDNNMGQFIA